MVEVGNGNPSCLRGEGDDDGQPGRVDRGGERLAVGDVACEAVARVDDDAQAVRRCTRELLRPPDELLELVLDRVVELQPISRRKPSGHNPCL